MKACRCASFYLQGCFEDIAVRWLEMVNSNDVIISLLKVIVQRDERLWLEVKHGTYVLGELKSSTYWLNAGSVPAVHATNAAFLRNELQSWLIIKVGYLEDQGSCNFLPSTNTVKLSYIIQLLKT